MKIVVTALLMTFSILPATAQSTATPVQPGSVGNSGCYPGQTTCFIPYSAANPMPVIDNSGGATTANQGTPNAGGATNSWPVQGAGIAGTPAGGVVSVQGVASGTTIPVTAAQPTASSLNATIVGTGTFATQDTITPSATVGVSTQSCTVACASTIVSGAHSVYGISGSATVTGTILVYDATSCSANGTVTPKKAFAYTVANAPIGISWADVPMINATGIAVCFSSTGPFTATASTTAFLSVDFK